MREVVTGASMLLRRIVATPWPAALPLVSLAIGIAGFLILIGIADHEFSYDRWVPDRERIFRFETTIAPAGAPAVRTVSVSPRVGAMLAERLPGTEATARLLPRTATLAVNGRQFSQKLLLTEPAFLRIIPIKTIGGDLAASLSRPDSIALSRAAAVKLFGSTDAVGRTAILPGGRTVAVAAVFEDLPRNSHIAAEALGSLRSPLFVDLAAAEKDWLDLGGYFYAKMRIAEPARELSETVTRLLETQAPMLKSGGLTVRIAALPLDALHVRSAEAGELPLGGFKPLLDRSRVLIVLLVAQILIALAALNYAFYLASTVAARTREIALRQFLGATPGGIFRLFWGEACMSIAIALAVALLAVRETEPWWSRFSEGEPTITDVIASPHAPLAYVALFALSILVSLFPFALARRIRPAESLRNRSAGSSIRGRAVAIVMTIQIALAAALMLGAIAVAKQVALLNRAPLGFDAAGVVVARSIPPEAPPSTVATIVDELGRSGDVAAAAAAQDEVGVGLVRAQANVEAATLGHEIPLNTMAAGPGWFGLLRVAPLAGRLLDGREGDRLRAPSPGAGAQPASAPAVINRSAARALGYPDPARALGTAFLASLDVGWRQPFTIVGVVPDLAHASLREGPKPYLYFDQRELETILYARARSGFEPARAAVAAKLKAVFPETPPAVTALPDDISKHYEDEIRLRTVLLAGSVCVLGIALMGIAALARTIVSYRMREIALRRLFGATGANILGVLGWQFSRPLVVGYAVAAAGAWLLIARWLNGFTLRAPPGPLEFGAVFVVTGVACAATAWAFVRRLLRLRPAAVLHHD